MNDNLTRPARDYGEALQRAAERIHKEALESHRSAGVHELPSGATSVDAASGHVYANGLERAEQIIQEEYDR